MASSMVRDHGDLLAVRVGEQVGAAQNCTVPSWLASRNDCEPPWAMPPMWKVRIVSCVPGSPIDCAAMMPTASPGFTLVPRARSRP